MLHALGARAIFRHRSSDRETDAFDLVVTLGGDGTLLWASQGIGANQPVIAVNSAPQDSVGYFCGVQRGQLADGLSDALSGKLRATTLTRMRVELDRKTCSTRVLNDALFSHSIPAATTRYAIRVRGREEEHKSSGVWISTAAGSSAAICSAGGQVQPISSKRLQFLVREPYAFGKTPCRLRRGLIGPSERLELQSRMRAGRLYLDGPHVWHPVEIGSWLSFSRSPEPLTLLGFRR
ncbi:MAG: NAD(+)/NADH kinase [Polyangiales bacterium]